MSRRYRKRPVEVEAIRWTGGNESAIRDFFQFGGVAARREDDKIAIRTLEGTMTAAVGDWIIRGVQGECYPCKPDIFEKTYEPVEDVA